MVQISYASNRQGQQGNILFMAIALLAALSILGLSAMRTALTQEKISMSLLDLNIATEAAESALRHGQRQLKTAYQETFEAGFSKTHELGAEPPDLSDWNNDIYQVSSADLHIDQSSKAMDTRSEVEKWLPKYRLEEFFEHDVLSRLGSNDSKEQSEPLSTSYFRVIARGLGLDGESEVLLESIVIEQTR